MQEVIELIEVRGRFLLPAVGVKVPAMPRFEAEGFAAEVAVEHPDLDAAEVEAVTLQGMEEMGLV